MVNRSQPSLSLSGTQVCDIVRGQLVAHVLAESGDESEKHAEHVRRTIRWETKVSNLAIDSLARCSLGTSIASALQNAGMVMPAKAAEEISHTIDDAQANDHTVASLGNQIKANLVRCLTTEALYPKKEDHAASAH